MGRPQTAETRRKISERHKGKPISPETRKKISEKLKGRPSPRKGAIVSEETRRKLSAAGKGRVQSRETRDKISLGNNGKTRSDEAKKHLSETRKQMGIRLSDETKQKISLAGKGRVFTEEHRMKIASSLKGHPGYVPSEEIREKISNSLKGRPSPNKGRKASPETLIKLSKATRGENNPRWLGGVSFEPYCKNFNREFKDKVREKFGRRCFVCGITEEKLGKGMCCHHTDYNKMQGCGQRPWSIVPLCMKCHGKANSNRWYWFSLLYNNWIYRYIEFDSNLI